MCVRNLFEVFEETDFLILLPGDGDDADITIFDTCQNNGSQINTFLRVFGDHPISCAWVCETREDPNELPLVGVYLA